MPRYKQSSINEVSRRNNLAEIVSGYVHLKRNGTSHVGLCPFHKEKTPSFHVDEDKQLYYCFGCGEGGNVFDFVMKAENLDFVDAVQFLAQRAGVTLEEEKSAYGRQEEDNDLRKRILEMNRLAARHFYDNLARPDAKIALDYMKRRGLDKATAVKFGIGFAPETWSTLLDYMKEKGYTQEELLTAGLVVRNEKGRYYDKFRNRLMFPIIDVRGNVIAFGGRALGEGDPAKYMNSPETPVFHKGRNLFSLNNAKQLGTKEGLILVEGYMDVIALYQKGIQNAVAGLGTALTEDQARLIKRYASQVYVCYDSDEAGQKAAQKALGLLTDAGNTVKVITYTGAKDPDEFIQKKGVESFRKLLSEARESVEYQLLRLRQRFDIYDLSPKISFLGEAAKVLAEIDSEMAREAYMKRVSAETDISVESIRTEVNKLIYYRNKKETRKELLNEGIPERIAPAREETVTGKANMTYKTERTLLNVIFYHRKAWELAKESVLPEWFSGDIHRKIFSEILSYREGHEEVHAAEFLTSLSDSRTKQGAAAILYTSFEGDALQAVKDAKLKLENAYLTNKAAVLAGEGKVREANEIYRRLKERRG